VHEGTKGTATKPIHHINVCAPKPGPPPAPVATIDPRSVCAGMWSRNLKQGGGRDLDATLLHMYPSGVDYWVAKERKHYVSDMSATPIVGTLYAHECIGTAVNLDRKPMEHQMCASCRKLCTHDNVRKRLAWLHERAANPHSFTLIM
jgi:hypothetical protein